MSSELAKKNALQILGLGRISRQAASGEELCLEAIRSGKAALVLVSSDASSLTRKKFPDKCQFYGVTVLDVPFTMEEMGKGMGQGPRSSVALLSQGLAETFTKRVTEITGENNSGSN